MIDAEKLRDDLDLTEQEKQTIRFLLSDMEVRYKPDQIGQLPAIIELVRRIDRIPAILALVEREAEMQKRLDDVIADYLDGRREVDKALNEFGYDDIRFADVRHGWLFSTNRIKEWPEVKKAFEAYDLRAWKKEQELAKAAMGGEGA